MSHSDYHYIYIMYVYIYIYIYIYIHRLDHSKLLSCLLRQTDLIHDFNIRPSVNQDPHVLEIAREARFDQWSANLLNICMTFAR